MLKPCPECGKQISDKAKFCPNCGYTKRNKVTERLPNGFGSITKCRNRKKPYYVRVTVGKDENGRPILRSIKPHCFFDTYEQAYMALVKWHEDPYDPDKNITMQELYERWSKEYFKKLDPSSTLKYHSTWAYSHSIHGMKIKDIRTRHLKACIENAKVCKDGETKYPTDNVRRRIKSMLNLMFDYALEYELVPMNYARNFSLNIEEEPCEDAHKAFTDEELDKLKANITNRYVAMILIQYYLGYRPQELCKIKLENINFENWSVVGGMKTFNGKSRVVPIHSKIQPAVKKFYDESVMIGSEYLFNNTKKGVNMSYTAYRYQFKKVLGELKMNPEHKPHDPRKTFITNAKAVKMDEFALKRIVGHSIQKDITEAVYTERPYSWLVENIEKLP